MLDPRDSFYRHLQLDEKSKEALKLYRFIKAKMLKDSEVKLEQKEKSD